MNGLKKRRDELGMTQEQVAVASQVSARSYQAYEADRRSPQVAVAFRIAKTLNTTVEALWGQSGMMTHNAESVRQAAP